MAVSNPNPALAFGLLSYNSIRAKAQFVDVAGTPVAHLQEEDFKRIIRQFLCLIPFDAEAYLQANPDLATAIADGIYTGSPRQHFLDHGYFEGRRIRPGFQPNDTDPTDQDIDLPPDDMDAVYRGLLAIEAERFADAQIIFAELHRRYGPRERFLRPLAQCYSRLGQYRRAAALFEDVPLKSLSTVELMTRHLVFRVLNLTEDASDALELAAAKTRYTDSAIDRSLATLHLDGDDLGRARPSFARLSRDELGGDGISAQAEFDRLWSQARDRLRFLLAKVKSATATLPDALELTFLLARTGFRTIAARRLDAGVQALRAAPDAPAAAVQHLADAVRLCHGAAAAAAALQQLKNIPDATLRDARLLYAAHQYDGALARLGAPQNPDEAWFQCRVDSLLMLGRTADALDVCRDWRVRLPGSGSWPNTTLRVLFDHGVLHDTTLDLAAADQAGAAAIPKTIVQYWNDADIPNDVLHCMASWTDNNPDCEYRRFCDTTAAAMLHAHYGPAISDAFERCYHPAMRADYFLLGYIYALGGCYIDADEFSDRPLRTVLQACAGKSLLLVRDRWMGLFNSPLLSVPQHPLIGRAFRQASDALIAAAGTGLRLPIWGTVGTGLLSRVFVEAVLDGDAALIDSTVLISEWDSARISREENLAYKSDPKRNWRMV